MAAARKRTSAAAWRRRGSGISVTVRHWRQLCGGAAAAAHSATVAARWQQRSGCGGGCSNKQCLVVAVFHAESFGQMKCMVTACVEGEPVRWRIRQQQEEFCYLVQNGKIGPHHDGLYLAQMAQTSIVVLRRCLPLWPSRDPQLMKGR